MPLPPTIQSVLKEIEATRREATRSERAQGMEDAREARIERKRMRRAKELLRPLLTMPEFTEVLARARSLGMPGLRLSKTDLGWAAIKEDGSFGHVQWVKYGGYIFEGSLPAGWAEAVLVSFESGEAWRLIEDDFRRRLRDLRVLGSE